MRARYRRYGAPVAVLGAGLAGLAAAWELKRANIPVRVYEAGGRVAGLAASHRDDDGFSYDTGAHFITNRLATALGVAARCRDVERYGETVWLSGKTYDYPLGLMRVPRFMAAAASARLGSSVRSPKPHSAAEWFRATYGEALADEVALPLIEAWSGALATDLSPAVGEKIPGGIAETVMLKAAARLTHRAVAIGYCREQPQSVHVWHVYPEGGVSALCESLAAELSGDIRLESPVERVVVERGRAVAVRVAGRDEPASAVVSTAPVNVLPRLVEGAPALDRFRAFRFRPMIFVNMRFEGRGLLSDVVTWTPGGTFPFFRVTEAPRSMPWLAPEGKTMLTVDLGAEVGDAHWTMSDEALGALCLEHLERIAPGLRARYLGCRVLKTPIAYPVFLNEYEDARRALEDSTGVDALLSVGRNGEFAHSLMEDVYWRTVTKVRRLAEALLAYPMAA